MIGSRPGPDTTLRRLVARAMARTLTAYVVPDARIAGAAGLDLRAAGVEIAATPRHASLLLVVGELPDGLRTAATVLYAQMPRPRAILALGSDATSPLPQADVVAALDQTGLVEGLARVRTLLASHAWTETAEPFTAAMLDTADQADVGMDHGAHGHGAHAGHDMPRDEHVGHGVPTDHASTGGAHDAHAAPPADQAGGEDDGKHAGHVDHGAHHDTADRDGPTPGSTARHGGHAHLPTETPSPERHDHHNGADHSEHAAMEHGEHGHGRPDANHDPHAAMGHGHPRGAHEHHAGMDHDDRPSLPAGAGHADHPHMRRTFHPGMGHDGHPEADHDHHAAMDHRDDPDHAGMGHDAHDDLDHSDHGHMNHSDDAHVDHGTHAEPDHGAHAHMDHSAMGHDMSGHDHHMMEGGFMSMVAMTQDLPRSQDGLPMEWVETAFGPLFPGLPAGLGARLTLDGDTVAAATIDTGYVRRGIATSLRGPAVALPDRLADLDPLAPAAYRVLAAKALAALQYATATEDVDRASIGALERERIASHLGWLATFLELLGIGALADRAARLHLAVVQAPDLSAMQALRPRIERLTRDVGRAPMLARRTAGIGRLDSGTLGDASGPVARASGRSVDARLNSAAYRALGFEPVVRERGDVHARLQIRLVEVRQSLDLLAMSGTTGLTLPEVPAHLSGSGMATVETPRGSAHLHVVAHHGTIREVHLSSPSPALIDLVPTVAGQAELADALIGIASLDLSPWEIDQ